MDFALYWSEKQLLEARKQAAKAALAESIKAAKQEYETKLREAKERYKFTKKTAKRHFKQSVRPPGAVVAVQPAVVAP